ncbi:MAG: hypothetical protein QM426_05045 [Euryarchaeota archaeon]|nr:hypothetical protein [Euryarchaeota archaeon]
MTLPELCPLDETQTCKGRDCHLFCLEWRSREPTCLIGYNTTSKVRSNKAGRNKDTYAEDTFRKLGQKPKPRWKNVSEKGDWTPTRLVERPQKRPVERREERASHAAETDSQNLFFGGREESRGEKPEKSPEERLQKRHVADESEKASLRLEARLKKEPLEENSTIYANPQAKVQEKPKVQERVISRDKHATIFSSCEEEKKDIYLFGREEKAEKAIEKRDKRKKLDEAMSIDLPDNYEEEFWS